MPNIFVILSTVSIDKQWPILCIRFISTQITQIYRLTDVNDSTHIRANVRMEKKVNGNLFEYSSRFQLTVKGQMAYSLSTNLLTIYSNNLSFYGRQYIR